MNDTQSMTIVFLACRDVLESEQRPIHYAELTRLAFKRLGMLESSVNWHRQIEDVREKMLIAGQHGSFYVSQPHCLGALRKWFRSVQEDLFNADEIQIPASLSSSFCGAHEAVMRFWEMKPKTSASVEKRAMACARGLILESHVRDFFRRQWPSLVADADNVGQWSRWCDHDFKLRLPNRTIRVDVWGRADNGYWRASDGKRAVDLHLQVDGDGNRVRWVGVARSSDFREGLMPIEAESPIRMSVWLNCLRDGISYAAVAGALDTARAA